MEQKFEDDSDSGSERQGTYYQFLIERKVPKGTLRHVASLINVTYEFIPDNYNHKRRKVHEESDPTFSFGNGKKENNNLLSNLKSQLATPDFSSFQNLELKKLEDKPMHADIVKTAPLRTNQMSKLQPLTKVGGESAKEDCDIITICKKSKSKQLKRQHQDVPGQESQLSFLKNRKLIP